MKRTTPHPLLMAAALLVLLAGCTKPTVQAPSTSTSTLPQAAATTSPAPTSAATIAVTSQKPVLPETNPPGDIPDNQAFVLYTTAGGFALKVPEGWSRTITPTSVEFTDKLNTIRAMWTPATGAPTVASVTSIDVPKLKTSEAAFLLKSVKAVKLSAGPAVLTTYQENSTANPVTGKQYRLDVERYALFAKGTRVDLILLSPVGADNVDPWKIVKESLAWK